MPTLTSMSGQSSMVGGALWVQHLMLGSVAIVIAVLTVAGVGAAMLTGRTDVRRGGTVILGCFVVFGAPLIAAGLREVLGSGVDSSLTVRAASPPTIVAPPSPPPVPEAYDPYAGASVPQQR